jgi:hypothetical protein
VTRQILDQIAIELADQGEQKAVLHCSRLVDHHPKRRSARMADHLGLVVSPDVV